MVGKVASRGPKLTEDLVGDRVLVRTLAIGARDRDGNGDSSIASQSADLCGLWRQFMMRE